MNLLVSKPQFSQHSALCPDLNNLCFSLYSGYRLLYSLFKILSKPGIWLQHITTKEPTDDQLEVSILALKSAFGDKLEDYMGKKYKAEAIS